MIPRLVTKPPSGDEWLHEIKYDGYRMQLVKTGGRVRLFTRSGRDWTKRYPRVIAATKVINAASYVIDGELVVEDEDGGSDFEMLHSRKHDATAISPITLRRPGRKSSRPHVSLEWKAS